jgi:hypothetical protein
MRTLNRLMNSVQASVSKEVDHVDLDLNVRLDVEGLSRTIESKVLRLERDGIFVGLQSGDLPNVNNTAHFSIEFDQNAEPFEGNGVVRWIHKNAHGSPAGCGVEFTYLRDSDKQRVLQCLKRTKA